MAKINTRQQFKEYCLRKLGWPVLEINVDDDQVEDRIDDALSFWRDYHYDGTEKLFMKHRITQQDIDRQWIYCPDAVQFVTGIMPFDQSNASINMFDLRYQLRLHDLYDFTSVSYVSYEITMQHIRTLNLLFSGTPQFRFNRHQNKVFLDIDWTRDVEPGDHIVVECYRVLQPDTIILTGTVTGNASSEFIYGVATKFDQEIVPFDFITLDGYGEQVQVKDILSPSILKLVSPPVHTYDSATVTISGLSDIWNDRYLKKLATAKIKQQWGTNMKKFEGIQMPGGVTLNGQKIYDEATQELEKMEEEIYQMGSLPSEIFTG